MISVWILYNQTHAYIQANSKSLRTLYLPTPFTSHPQKHIKHIKSRIIIETSHYFVNYWHPPDFLFRSRRKRTQKCPRIMRLTLALSAPMSAHTHIHTYTKQRCRSSTQKNTYVYVMCSANPRAAIYYY